MTGLQDPLPAEQIQRLLHDKLGATVSIVDGNFNLRYVNAGFAQAFDLPAQALIGRNVREFYSESDFAEFSPHLLRAFAGEPVAYERVGRLRDRHAIWRAVSLVPWRDQTNGRVLGAVMSSLPVHELMVATESLRVANARLSSHMDNSPLTVFELDGELVVTRVSSRVRQLLGLEPSAVVGRNLWTVLGDDLSGGPEDDAANGILKAAFSRLRAGLETSNRVVSVHRQADGADLHCEWFNSALVGGDGQVASLMCLVEDSTVRVRAQAQLRLMAMTDALTGLANRAAFAERLLAALNRASRSRAHVAVLYLDLDGFKSVNDTYGHASGDQLLREVALRLKTAIRDTDTLARIGGDEFAVLLDTEVHAQTAQTVCDRILSLLAPPCVFDIGQALIGASIGVAQHPPMPGEVEALLARADAAMYAAKRAGKGRVHHAA